ncbi:MAG TPA: DUF4157 domain-containing protein [Polyangia bacterium]
MGLWSVIRGGAQRLSSAVEETFEKTGEEAKRADSPACERPKDEAQDGVDAAVRDVGVFARDQIARLWEGSTSVAEGVVEGTAAVLNGVGEGVAHVGHGVAETLRGNLGAGLKEIGLGTAQATVGGVVDGVLLAGARAASAVQVVAHLEQRERGLNADELTILRATFGDAVDYSEVRIKEGRAGLFSANDRAFTSGNTIFMKMDPSHPGWQQTLVHEMVHVWQYQNGGADYQSKSLAAQFITRDAYQWQTAALEEKPWASLNPEDQGALIEEMYRQGFFDRGTFVAMDAGGAPVDRKQYAAVVMNELRNRRGAP